MRRSPRIQRLTLSKPGLNANAISAIENLQELETLHMHSHRLPDMRGLQKLRHLKVIGSSLAQQPPLKTITELTFLDSHDDQFNADWTEFIAADKDTKRLDFLQLKSFVLSTMGDLNVLNTIIPHMNQRIDFTHKIG